MNKLWYIQYDGLLPSNIKEQLLVHTTWINFKFILLNESSQTKKRLKGQRTGQWVEEGLTLKGNFWSNVPVLYLQGGGIDDYAFIKTHMPIHQRRYTAYK